MKILKIIFFIFLVSGVSSSIYAENSLKKKSASADAGPYDGISKLKYTTEQIESLTKSAEYRRAVYKYMGGFYSVKMPKTAKKIAALKAKYAKKGKTPFCIGVSIYEIKESHGKKKQASYYKGSADIYIIDMENKKIVESKRVSLKKLCTS
jgi:hypothetical protein